VFALALFSFSRAFARSVGSLARSLGRDPLARMKNNLERGTLLFFLFRFASLRALTILCSSLLLLRFVFFSTAR